MPRENFFNSHWLTFGTGFLHRFKQRDGDDAFAGVRLGGFPGGKAARKIFDVILIFASMMAAAFKAEIVILLLLKPFYYRMSALSPRNNVGIARRCWYSPGVMSSVQPVT